MLKGHATIELTDVNTGEKQVYEDDNMFTNALNYLMNEKMMGMFGVDDMIYPIATRALGGILLFPKAIKEDVEQIYPPTVPIAWAGSSTDAGDDTQMGTYNTKESGKTDNGYKHVWDFSTSQGNGTIAAVCLTHDKGGEHWNTGDRIKQCLSNTLTNRDYSQNTIDSFANYTSKITFENVATVDKDEYHNANLFPYAIPFKTDLDGVITAVYDGDTVHIIKYYMLVDGISHVNVKRPNQSQFLYSEELGSVSPENEWGYGMCCAILSDGKLHCIYHRSNKSGEAARFNEIIFDTTTWEGKESSFSLSGYQIAPLMWGFGTEHHLTAERNTYKYDDEQHKMVATYKETVENTYTINEYNKGNLGSWDTNEVHQLAVIRGDYLYCISMGATGTIYKIGILGNHTVSAISAAINLRNTITYRNKESEVSKEPPANFTDSHWYSQYWYTNGESRRVNGDVGNIYTGIFLNKADNVIYTYSLTPVGTEWHLTYILPDDTVQNYIIPYDNNSSGFYRERYIALRTRYDYDGDNYINYDYIGKQPNFNIADKMISLEISSRIAQWNDSRRACNSIYPWFDLGYLATINNLSNPFTKTAAQTMKISYTITDAS